MKKSDRNPEGCLFSADIQGVWICNLLCRPCGNVEMCPDSDDYEEEMNKKTKGKFRGNTITE